MLKRIIAFLTILVALSGCETYVTRSSKAETLDEKIIRIEEKQEISSAELKNIIDEEIEGYFLIDVRTKDEYNDGHIPTAINIPHTEISEHLSEIPEDKLIIVYCKLGSRASIAEKELKKLGYKRIINFGRIKSYKYKLEE